MTIREFCLRSSRSFLAAGEGRGSGGGRRRWDGREVHARGKRVLLGEGSGFHLSSEDGDEVPAGGGGGGVASLSGDIEGSDCGAGGAGEGEGSRRERSGGSGVGEEAEAMREGGGGEGEGEGYNGNFKNIFSLTTGESVRLYED